jgi:DNA helicase MCM9
MNFVGTIVRTGPVKILELSKQYECMNPKCGFRFTVRADPEQDNLIPQPRTCPASVRRPSSKANDDQAAPSKPYKCSSVNLKEVGSYCVDYQEIILRDQLEKLTISSVPRTVAVVLRGDLVDKFNPGDEVSLVGFPVRQWKFVVRGTRCGVDVVIHANCINLLNEVNKSEKESEEIVGLFHRFWKHFRTVDTPYTGRDHIIKSVSRLYGIFYEFG